MIHKNWADLIKPSQLDVKPGNDPTRQATVTAEPLERGFGLTLGNALRRVVERKEVVNRTTGENLGQITLSVGVSEFKGRDDTPDKLISRADEALYDAKEAGRNRVMFYGADS